MPQLYEPDSTQAPRSGLLLLQLLVLGVFFAFALRIWFLQVHKGEEFVAMARENQLRNAFIYATRGQIRDRNGQLLALNQPGFALTIVRESCKDLEGTLGQVSAWTGIEVDKLRKKFEQGKRRVKPFEQQVLVPDIPFEILPRIEANSVFWPGIEILIRPRRVYPFGPLMAHILGYVAEANEEELEKDPDLRPGDIVGRQGVEFVFDKRLRGAKGLKQLEVDATGRELSYHVLRQPQGGEDIPLSIDLNLQAFASKKLEGEAGAVVVLEPNTGQVLALVTQPSYDNNAFTSGLNQTQWSSLQNHPRHPLQNRVIQSVYPPGSVWKLLVAACAMHEGIKPTQTAFCSGSYTLGTHEFRCWKKEGHGTINMREALIHSCDVYFYQLGEKLGVDRISRYALASGFGAPTGIDLPHEKGGLAPTREWKRKRLGEPWHGGENLNLAIGQGYTLVHPLQVARFIAALVNGGKILKPNIIANAPIELQGELALEEDQRKLILSAMVDTVERGTGTSIKRADARMGAKTGTAQVVKIEEVRTKTLDMPYRYRDHAWIATWGEKAGKSYVVVVLLEHGGHGGSDAGPIARSVYDYLLGPAPAKVADKVRREPEPAPVQD